MSIFLTDKTGQDIDFSDVNVSGFLRYL